MRNKILNHRVGINVSYGKYLMYQKVNIIDCKLSRNRKRNLMFKCNTTKTVITKHVIMKAQNIEIRYYYEMK